jgi:hypothetical protein
MFSLFKRKRGEITNGDQPLISATAFTDEKTNSDGPIMTQ